jgi:hypothetical protein
MENVTPLWALDVFPEDPVPLNDFLGTVQRTVFSARHAGLWSGGMGTVSDDI